MIHAEHTTRDGGNASVGAAGIVQDPGTCAGLAQAGLAGAVIGDLRRETVVGGIRAGKRDGLGGIALGERDGTGIGELHRARAGARPSGRVGDYAGRHPACDLVVRVRPRAHRARPAGAPVLPEFENSEYEQGN